MSRLGMLYAVTSEELAELKQQNPEDMYEHMLENIEDKYISTPRACELDKAWEGIHYCLNGGEWHEDNSPQAKVIFCGDTLLDLDYNVITLKSQKEIAEIVSYLRQNDLSETIRFNFNKIDEAEYTLPKDSDNMEYLLDWGQDLLPFYELAEKDGLQVIFTVDL